MNTEPYAIRTISFKDYVAIDAVNQSTLKKFGEASTPAHFKYELEHPSEKPDYLKIGGYVDCFLFTPERIGPEYRVFDGERRGKKWKAFQQTHAGKVILNASEFQRAVGVLERLAAHENTQALLKLCHKQVAFFAVHPVHRCLMKGMVDLWPNSEVCDPQLTEWLFDIKTAESASPAAFAQQCVRYGYTNQAAWYIDLMALFGARIRFFGFIVAENEPPHEVAIHWLEADSSEVAEARAKNEEWLVRYLECKNNNHWPGYGDAWMKLQLKPRRPDFVPDTLQ